MKGQDAPCWPGREEKWRRLCMIYAEHPGVKTRAGSRERRSSPCRISIADGYYCCGMLLHACNAVVAHVSGWAVGVYLCVMSTLLMCTPYSVSMLTYMTLDGMGE